MKRLRLILFVVVLISVVLFLVVSFSRVKFHHQTDSTGVRLKLAGVDSVCFRTILPKLFFKKMRAYGDDGTLYTIYLTKGGGYGNLTWGGVDCQDSAVSILLDSPLYEKPFTFYGKMISDSSMVFSDEYYQSPDALTAFETSAQGLFLNDSMLVLNVDSSSISIPDVLLFRQTDREYIVKPINYYKRIFFERQLYDPINDNSNLYIRSLVFEGKFHDDLNRVIKSRISSALLSNSTLSIEEMVRVYELCYENINIKYDIAFLENEVITIRVCYDSYGHGAAHDLYMYRYINYDLLKKKIIKLSDIIRKSEMNRFEELCKQKFKKKYNKSDSDLVSFKFPEDFAVYRNGLYFNVSLYEMGSFVDGLPYIFVSFSEISDLMYSEGVAKRLIHK